MAGPDWKDKTPAGIQFQEHLADLGHWHRVRPCRVGPAADRPLTLTLGRLCWFRFPLLTLVPSHQ
jgi:hypothetical protein